MKNNQTKVINYLRDNAKTNNLLPWEFESLFIIIQDMSHLNFNTEQSCADWFSQRMDSALGVTIGEYFEHAMYCDENVESWVSNLWTDDNWYSRPEKIDISDAVRIIRGAIQDDIEIPKGITPAEVVEAWNWCCDNLFVQEDDYNDGETDDAI